MKSKDIEAGHVYAYRRGNYGTTEQVVFLVPPVKGNLYGERSKTAKGFVPEPNSQRPVKRAWYNGGDIGWLAAIGKDVSGATLDEALAGIEPGKDRDYRYYLITVMSAVLGDYAEVTAREEEAKRANAQRRQNEEAKNLARSLRMTGLHARLAAHGVACDLARNGSTWSDSDYYRKNYPPTYFLLTETQAACLADLLDGKADDAN